ncbi:nonstructural protein [Dipodfec virus UOA04_Rod_1082]|nr:nonstructural protein [Dipodfec virus UOA04_Rod_1082]
MKFDVFSIYDSVANTYFAPTISVNRDVAIRSFCDLINRDVALSAHAKDYSLVFVGTFDNVSGELVPVNLEVVFSGDSVIQSDPATK